MNLKSSRNLNKQFWQRVRDRVELGWCKGELARDIFGNRVLPLDPRAWEWCLEGACIKEGAIAWEVLSDIPALLNPYLPKEWKLSGWNGKFVCNFNDSPEVNKIQVLDVLDKLIFAYA